MLFIPTPPTSRSIHRITSLFWYICHYHSDYYLFTNQWNTQHTLTITTHPNRWGTQVAPPTIVTHNTPRPSGHTTHSNHWSTHRSFRQALGYTNGHTTSQPTSQLCYFHHHTSQLGWFHRWYLHVYHGDLLFFFPLRPLQHTTHSDYWGTNTTSQLYNFIFGTAFTTMVIYLFLPHSDLYNTLQPLEHKT